MRTHEYLARPTKLIAAALLTLALGAGHAAAEGSNPVRHRTMEIDGHFALEEDGAFIARRIREFVAANTASDRS